MAILEEIAEGLREGNTERVEDLVRRALDQGCDWKTISDDGLFKGMEVVGRLFRDEDMFIPEVMMSAHAMQAGFEILEPHMKGGVGSRQLGKVVLGTVKGDLHNLGKDLVSVMLKGAGFEVIDLGIDVSADRFVSAARDVDAQIIGMSALLTYTMPYMKTVIDALADAGLKGKVKTLIGGACVDRQFADSIGADGYAENAAIGVTQARQLLGLQ